MELGNEEQTTKEDTIAQEAEVIRLVRQGEKNRFRILVERYQARIYALCLRVLRNRHDAEDTCQEAFVRAFRSLKRFDTRYPFENWLLKIATNLCRNQLKRRRGTSALPADCLIYRDKTPRFQSEETLKVMQETISEAMGRLTETKRTALSLLHQSSRSYAEIAEIMDLPLGTVKTMIHRGRTAIRAALSERGLLES